MKILEGRFKLLHDDIIANYQDFLLTTDHDPSSSIINPDILHFILAFDRVFPGIVSHYKDLNRIVFATHDDLVI